MISLQGLIQGRPDATAKRRLLLSYSRSEIQSRDRFDPQANRVTTRLRVERHSSDKTLYQGLARPLEVLFDIWTHNNPREIMHGSDA